MKKKNILIVENETSDFTQVKEVLERELSEVAQIFPKFVNTKDLNFDNSNYLIQQLIGEENGFQNALKFYSEIDIFIIDVFLKNKTDRIGLLFATHILKNKIGNFKIIIVSNTLVTDEILNDSNVISFNKFDEGIDFPEPLAKVTGKLLTEILAQQGKNESKNTTELSASANSRKSSQQMVTSDETIGTIVQEQLPVEPVITNQECLDSTVSANQTSEISKEAIDSLINYVGQQKHDTIWDVVKHRSNRIIDGLISITFYGLLSITTIYAAWNIFWTIIVGGFLSHPKDNSSVAATVDTNILKISEHIFLYLLPIFIVFGFFHYYKNNSRISLIGGNLDSNDDVNSTRTMNLTKTLFLSSIISYVLIKIIELIFILDPINITRIVASISLLVLLMTYFIFLDRKPH